MDSIKKLEEVFKQDLKDYKSIPFWSWNNNIEEDELCRQIEDMNEAGIGGFIMHARTGLSIEYLGEKWFSCVKACLDKAKELNMNAWVYDENGWPSGFVGGKLLEVEEYRANFLECKELDYFDKDAFAVFKESGDKFERILENEKLDKYYCIYLKSSPANTDILNPIVVDAFIKETHEKYYERFKDYFGNVLVGFFTDEPQYYRWATPYTKGAEKYFTEVGEDIRDGLIYLFYPREAGNAFKIKYFTVLNKLFTENFYGKLYSWCEQHGCKLTGHAIEETSLEGQMWGCADVMPSYEYEHIPGMDKLSRDCENELAPAQVGSVASQLGIKHVLTETYGCSGNDVTPKELRSVGDFQYFKGVNLMCQHLYPYSMSAQGKWDHPPVFSRHSNWFDGFKDFNDYFTKLGYIIVNTDEEYDVGIISPIRSVYPNYVRFDSSLIKEIDKKYAELLSDFRKRGITFQILDETLLEKHGSVENGVIKLGKNSYSTIVLPYMTTIGSNTLKLLKEYEGKLFLSNSITMIDGRKGEVDLVSNTTIEEIEKNAIVDYTCEDGLSFMAKRRGDLGDFIFVKNLSRLENSKVIFKNVAERYVKLNLEDLTYENISNEMTIPNCESLILIKSEEAKEVEIKEEKEDITNDFVVAGISENYLVVDYVSISKDGINYTNYMPIPQISEILLREDYKGDIFVRYKINSKIDTIATVVMERADCKYIRFNGKDISMTRGDFDINFVESEVKVIKGENFFEYSFYYYQHEGVHFALFDPLATESLRNCLSYDTSIENIYLRGHFKVDANQVIIEENSLPPLTSNLKDEGYPFFNGKLILKGKYDYNGKGRVIIDFIGRFNEAKVTINGKEKKLVMDSKGDITNLLSVGENNIEVTINSSLRNLFGPHHFKHQAEPLGVSPYLFNFRGSWGNGVSGDYTDKYNSVPFGVDKIEIIKK